MGLNFASLEKFSVGQKFYMLECTTKYITETMDYQGNQWYRSKEVPQWVIYKCSVVGTRKVVDDGDVSDMDDRAPILRVKILSVFEKLTEEVSSDWDQDDELNLDLDTWLDEDEYHMTLDEARKQASEWMKTV